MIKANEGMFDSPRWAAAFFATALLSAGLGLGGLHEAPADVARSLFFVFLVLAIVPLLRRARRETA